MSLRHVVHRGAFWIALAVCGLPSRSAAAQELPTAGGAPEAQSQYALEQQFSRLSQDVELIAQQIKLVEQTAEALTRGKAQVAAPSFDARAAGSALSDLKNQLLLVNGRVTPELARSQTALARILNQPMLALYSVTQGIRVQSNDARGEPLQSLMLQIDDFDKSYHPGKVLQLMAQPPDLAVAKTIEIADLETEFNTLRQKVASLVDELISKAGAIKTGLAKQLDSKRRELARLDDQLKRLVEQRAAVDQRLIYSIYAMIGSLVVLFFLVRFFSRDVQHSIIDNRVLVEVVAMAFLLLTIIILATGNKLEPQALGTLLGTIAGYIFGRRIEASPATPRPSSQAKPAHDHRAERAESG